jgi:hypothetical protein
MVRQPFRAEFRAEGFDFVVLTVHAGPEQNLRELEELDHLNYYA